MGYPLRLLGLLLSQSARGPVADEDRTSVLDESVGPVDLLLSLTGRDLSLAQTLLVTLSSLNTLISSFPDLNSPSFLLSFWKLLLSALNIPIPPPVP